jgi:hypothetical protein
LLQCGLPDHFAERLLPSGAHVRWIDRDMLLDQRTLDLVNGGGGIDVGICVARSPVGMSFI